MNAAISRALSDSGRRRGGIPGSQAQVSRSRWGTPAAPERRSARVDLPEPEFPKITRRGFPIRRILLDARAAGNDPARPLYSPGNDAARIAITATAAMPAARRMANEEPDPLLHPVAVGVRGFHEGRARHRPARRRRVERRAGEGRHPHHDRWPVPRSRAGRHLSWLRAHADRAGGGLARRALTG